MEREADVVVVGAGIVGCATAYFLARRGVRVVVVERGPVPGEQSRKNWGFVRQQGRDPLEMPLVVEANRLWQGLERELGADVEWTQGGNLALAADEKKDASIGVDAKPVEGAEVLIDGKRETLDEKWTYWEGPGFKSSLPIKWKIVDDPVDKGATVLQSDDPAAAGGRGEVRGVSATCRR